MSILKKKRIWLIVAGVLLLLALAFLIYAEQYYHADETALSALKSDGKVAVARTEYGWMFDGPSETEALIFYPGAKVEETAYAPLLYRIAEQGMDVCLAAMPFRLAFLGAGKADRILSMYDYEKWYIGGHSLGGVFAADYAAGHSGQLTGVVLLAAYPTKALDDSLTVTMIYGSEDRVLNTGRLQESIRLLPENHYTYVIEGGNHAQFGNYGKQSGDGEASISAEEQQRQTAELILKTYKDRNLPLAGKLCR